jgi:crotonobetainyl-CoA:carnitine CoA-transferase CaiB-like acyl-CoA transferase
MAETTRPGPLAKVRPIDSASALTAHHAAQILGDLAAAVIESEAPHDTFRGREHKCTSKLSREESPDETQGRSRSLKSLKRTAAHSHTPSSAGNPATGTSLC